VLRGGRPCLEPPLEELRLRHYRDQLGAFLGLPGKMKVRVDRGAEGAVWRALEGAWEGLGFGSVRVVGLMKLWDSLGKG